MATAAAVGDRVFVRDEHYVWLPARVLELEDDRALVRIDLPEHWDETTALIDPAKQEVSTALPDRWVPLSQYFNHRLPLQNDHTESTFRDLAELPNFHEASMLQQLKERHCRQLPYTRVGEILVAINPCQWIPDLYSRDQQRLYHQLFGGERKVHLNGTWFAVKKIARHQPFAIGNRHGFILHVSPLLCW